MLMQRYGSEGKRRGLYCAFLSSSFALRFESAGRSVFSFGDERTCFIGGCVVNVVKEATADREVHFSMGISLESFEGRLMNFNYSC